MSVFFLSFRLLALLCVLMKKKAEKKSEEATDVNIRICNCLDIHIELVSRTHLVTVTAINVLRIMHMCKFVLNLFVSSFHFVSFHPFSRFFVIAAVVWMLLLGSRAIYINTSAQNIHSSLKIAFSFQIE